MSIEFLAIVTSTLILNQLSTRRRLRDIRRQLDLPPPRESTERAPGG